MVLFSEGECPLIARHRLRLWADSHLSSSKSHRKKSNIFYEVVMTKYGKCEAKNSINTVFLEDIFD